MRRREFLATAGGAAAVAAAAGGAAAQQQPEFPSYLEGAKGGNFKDLRGNSEVTVEVGADPQGLAFAPTKIWIDPGTKVVFEWVSTGHNVLPKSIPDGASWEGSGDALESSGFTYEHTFETKGIYTYYCRPHEGAGMKGGIAVGDVGGSSSGGGGSGGGGGGGGTPEREDPSPKEMGVPFRPHFVGLATLLGTASSLVYVFYTLKYGESPHASSPNRK